MTRSLNFSFLPKTDTVQINLGDKAAFQAKDLGDFKTKHPKMYAVLNLLGLACTVGGKTILLDTATRQNIKDNLKLDVPFGTFVATALKNFQKEKITAAMNMKGDEIVMPSSLFDAVLQKVCKASMDNRKELKDKFVSKDGNIHTTHKDFLTALKSAIEEKKITLDTTDKRYKGLVDQLRAQVQEHKPEKPKAKELENELKNALVKIGKREEDPKVLIKESGGLREHVTKRGLELIALRDALSSPDLKGFSKEEIAAASKWVDAMIKKGASMGALTESDVVNMERLYQAGIRDAFAHFSPEQIKNLHAIIQIKQTPILAIEAAPTKPAQEKKLRDAILSTVDGLVRAAYDIKGADNKSMLAQSLGSGTAKLGMDPMRSSENKWLSSQLAMLKDEIENCKDGWFGRRQGHPLGPNFLSSLLMGDPEHSDSSEKLGVIGLIRKGFDQLPEAKKKELSSQMQVFEGQIKRLQGHLEAYAKLREPVITTRMDIFTEKTVKTHATMTKEASETSTYKATMEKEAEAVTNTHRFVVERDKAIGARNGMLEAFAEIETGWDTVSPWEVLSQGDRDLLIAIAEDTRSSYSQLKVDHEVMRKAIDRGLKSGGFTTISEVEKGAMPNWPAELRNSFVKYESSLQNLADMVEKAEAKHLPTKSAQPRRTRSMIFKREVLEGAKTKSKEAESDEVSNRRELRELRADARGGITKREAQERAEKNRELGLATQANLKATQRAHDAKRALVDEMKKLTGPGGWFSKGKSPIDALNNAERKEWESPLKPARRLELLNIGLKKAGLGSLDDLQEAAVENHELGNFLRAVSEYDNATTAYESTRAAVRKLNK